MTYVMTESEAKELKNMTAAQLFDILGDHPYPGATNLSGGAMGFMCFQVDGLWIAYDKGMWNVERHETQYPITPNFQPFGELTVRDVHAEISRVVKIGKSLHANTRMVATETNTTPSWEETKADCVGPDLPTEQTFVSTDRYRELEAELKTVTEERDDARKNYLTLVNNNPLSPTINTIAEKLGVCPAEPGPMFEKIDRLKSKADRAGLLSVVCRRLCGDENASIETVHKALDLFDDQRNALDYIGRSVYCDADDAAPHRLQSIGRLAAQMSTSLSEKTAEVAKLQEGIKNYKAQVDGLTKRLEQMTFERDTERIGKKWLSETVEDLKRTTVKLPNEHTLRRLFNRHNAPDKYDDGTPIPTIERFLLIIENLCRNADCAERRFEELNAISTRVNTESEDAHATLDEMGIPRWTTANNHSERYLSLSARLRQLFQTHTKV